MEKKDYSELVSQHDALARQVIDDLNKIEADLLALQGVKDQIESEGVQASRVIEGLVTVRMVHVPSLLSQVQSARHLIVERV